MEWSPVVGVKDPPGFDVGDCPFRYGVESVDLFVAVFVLVRQLTAPRFLLRRGQTGSDISLVTNSAVITDMLRADSNGQPSRSRHRHGRRARTRDRDQTRIRE